jgi:hypothetical protein
MMMTSWPRFLIALWPVAKELIRDLYRLHQGDIEKATTALQRIRDHGARLDEAERALDARIEAVRGREKS